MKKETQNHSIENAQNKPYKKEYIDIGVGLNEVDNLTPSKYFYKALESSKTYHEIEKKLQEHYKTQDLKDKEIRAKKECDILAIKIAQILEENDFVFSPIMLKSIHKRLFSGVFEGRMSKFEGAFRDYNITKEEPILGKNSVNYGNCDEILEYLSYDFDLESKKNYSKIPKEKWAENISKFISNIWQIHPFVEGNTRTTAVFTIKYLRKLGIECNNDIFKENSLYFRNALVLANYGNVKLNISPNNDYLISFFNKLIVDKNLDLMKMPESLVKPQAKETKIKAMKEKARQIAKNSHSEPSKDKGLER